jgi:hypothetical protein
MLSRLWCLQSYVAEDGVYHMVAKPEVIEEALLAEEELEKARVLSKTSWVWSERIKWGPLRFPS